MINDLISVEIVWICSRSCSLLKFLDVCYARPATLCYVYTRSTASYLVLNEDREIGDFQLKSVFIVLSVWICSRLSWSLCLQFNDLQSNMLGYSLFIIFNHHAFNFSIWCTWSAEYCRWVTRRRRIFGYKIIFQILSMGWYHGHNSEFQANAFSLVKINCFRALYLESSLNQSSGAISALCIIIIPVRINISKKKKKKKVWILFQSNRERDYLHTILNFVLSMYWICT